MIRKRSLDTRLFKISILSLVLIIASLACSFSFAGEGSGGDQVTTSVAETEAAQREMGLTVTGTLIKEIYFER